MRRLALACSGVALLLVGARVGAQMDHGGMGRMGAPGASLPPAQAASALDSRSSRGMTNPLRIPRAGSEVSGVVDGSRPFTLTARPADLAVVPGTFSRLWVYEAEQDGRKTSNPLIRVRRGDVVSIRFLNRLPEATNVHWHGLHVPRSMDGNPADLVSPGGEYRYEFRVDDRSALYWYHPHPHGTTAGQVYRGLAGLFIVEDEEDRSLARAAGLEAGVNDIPLVLQDREMGGSGEMGYSPGPMEWFHGTYSSTVLVNLTPKPFLAAEPRWHRFRVLNGSNARVYRLGLEVAGRLESFLVTGVDGGLLATAEQVRETFLSPGERVDVMVDLSRYSGREVFLKSIAFDPMENEMMGGMMGMGAGGNGEPLYLLRVAVEARAGGKGYDLPRLLASLPPSPVGAGTSSLRRFTITAGMMRWFIDGREYVMDEYPIVVDRGAREVWEIANATASMPHAMHIHGFHFRVLERRGTPDQAALSAGEAGLLATDRGMKDTVLVWPGETVRIALDFTHPFPGPQQYVFHCHNLEHESAGMMLNMLVQG